MGTRHTNDDQDDRHKRTLGSFAYGYGDLSADILRSQALKDEQVISMDIMSTLRRQCDLVMTSRAQGGHYACEFTVTDVVMGHPPLYDPDPYAARLADYVRAIGCDVAVAKNKLFISWS